MRYDHDAPTSVMEALIVHLLVWGQEQGYHWFALGMAPMSGSERSPVAQRRDPTALLTTSTAELAVVAVVKLGASIFARRRSQLAQRPSRQLRSSAG